MTIRFADVEPSPDVFAAVMATGILSIGARNHGYRLISDTLGVIATLGLVLLVALVVAKACVPGKKLYWDLTDPDVTLRLISRVAHCGRRRAAALISAVAANSRESRYRPTVVRASPGPRWWPDPHGAIRRPDPR